MPAPGPESPVDPKKALTLLLGQNSEVRYFFGLNPGPAPDQLHRTTLAADGRVRIAGPTLFSHYDADPDLTAATVVDGWFLTSDVGRIDEDGRLMTEVADRWGAQPLFATQSPEVAAAQTAWEKTIDAPVEWQPLVVSKVVATGEITRVVVDSDRFLSRISPES